MSETKQRKIAYIAQAQLIGCLLVILGHSIPLNWKIPNAIYLMDTFLYTFHMPLFFFVSGYLFYKTHAMQRYTYSAYVRKRSYRLLLPYVVLTIVGFFPKVLLSTFFHGEAELSLMFFIKAFLVPRENVWGHFWFLPTLLLISFLSFLFAKLKNKSVVVFAFITVLLFGLPLIGKVTDWFAVNDILKYACFYALGLLFADTAAEGVLTGKKTKYAFLLLLPLALAAYFLIQTRIEWVKTLKHEVIGIMMLLFVLAIAQCFDITNTKVGKFMCDKTYSIFILSWPFQSVVSIVFEQKLAQPYYITMPLAFAAGICGPIVTILLIDFIEKKANKRFLSPIIGG
ncbi:MAG: acyltransferase family protein [Clostridia bacterium]|nr:acyltransferase family protein [Clostridia bacterium]